MPLIHLPDETKQRLDAANPQLGAFTERELNHVLTEVLKEPKPPLEGFALFPIDRDIPDGAESYTQKVVYESGRAKPISGANPTQDLPTSGVASEEFVMRCRSYGVSAEWGLDELAASQFAGRPIDRDKMSAAMTAIETSIHDQLWDGDDDIYGLFNTPYLPRMVTATTLTSASTAADIIDLFAAIGSTIKGRMNGQELQKALTILVSDDAYGYLAATPRTSTSDKTLLGFILDTNPYIAEIRPCTRVVGKATGGGDTLIAYQRRNAKLAFKYIRPPRAQPPQYRNLGVVVPMSGRAGGLHIKYPYEMLCVELPA